MDAVAKVAQGDAAAAVKLAGADPSKMPDAINHFTGQAFEDAWAAQLHRAGDVAGPYYNYTPFAQGDSYTVATDHDLVVDAAHGVLANDFDPDGDTLTALAVTQTVHGTLTLNADGSFNYVPNPGYAGPDAFYYLASDGPSGGVPQVNIWVDGPHPVVTHIAATPNGVVQPNDIITLTVTMSGAVTVDETRGGLTLYTNFGPAYYQAASSTPDTLSSLCLPTVKSRRSAYRSRFSATIMTTYLAYPVTAFLPTSPTPSLARWRIFPLPMSRSQLSPSARRQASAWCWQATAE